MKKTLFLIFVIAYISVPSLYSQAGNKDSIINIPVISLSYSYLFPGGNLSKRYFSSSAIGGNFLIKNKKNLVFGLQGNFLFRDSVKETHIFDSIATSSGSLIDGNGMLADIRLYGRGFYIGGTLGKLFPVSSNNRNSGILIAGSIGFLQHKIRIENPGNVTPQIKGDYKKGYDRLCSGFAANQSIGYLYMGTSRLINFYAGLDFYQGWTKSRRSYDFDTMKKNEANRFDLLWGIRFSWMIPLNKRLPKDYYYF